MQISFGNRYALKCKSESTMYQHKLVRDYAKELKGEVYHGITPEIKNGERILFQDVVDFKNNRPADISFEEFCANKGIDFEMIYDDQLTELPPLQDLSKRVRISDELIAENYMVVYVDAQDMNDTYHLHLEDIEATDEKVVDFRTKLRGNEPFCPPSGHFTYGYMGGYWKHFDDKIDREDLAFIKAMMLEGYKTIPVCVNEDAPWLDKIMPQDKTTA